MPTMTEQQRFDKLTHGVRMLENEARALVRAFEAVKVADKPAPAPDPPTDWNKPWTVDSHGIVEDAIGAWVFTGGTKGLLSHRPLKHAIECANALAGIRNVAAVGPLLRDLQVIAKEHALCAAKSIICSHLMRLDQEPEHDA